MISKGSQHSNSQQKASFPQSFERESGFLRSGIPIKAFGDHKKLVVKGFTRMKVQLLFSRGRLIRGRKGRLIRVAR